MQQRKGRHKKKKMILLIDKIIEEEEIEILVGIGFGVRNWSRS